MLLRILKSVNRHCCVANTHALDHKTLNAHAQIRKTDLNPGLDNTAEKRLRMRQHY
jgi:hypothetical protein